jgi:DNA-binding transcriptional MerR regulator
MYKEKEIERLYWSIGEVADSIGVATSAIRFWLDEYKVPIKRSMLTGNRHFTKSDVALIHEIYRLLVVEEFTLNGARKKLLAAGMIPDQGIKPRPGRGRRPHHEEEIKNMLRVG